MAAIVQRIVPCLWFEDQAQDAVSLYTATFPHSTVGRVARYGAESARVSGRPEGSVLTVEFTLDGQPFTALNGGPTFRFNEAVSLAIQCDTQAEIDHYWRALSAGGDPKAQQCGWLKDRFGVSWQVTPRALVDWLTDPDPGRVARVTAAMLQMTKFDVAALERAARG